MSLEAKDLRGNEPAELRSTVRKLQEDLFKHKLKKTTNQLENTMLIRSTRRDIARVNTVLAERLRGTPVAPAERAAAVFEEAEASASASADKPSKTYMWGVLTALLTAYACGLAALAILK